MASQPSSSRPPPAEFPQPPAPTTIAALDDDLLREIFLRLPDLPSLACAAFTCRAFLGAVRSSPDFRRRFRALHASPLLALFETIDMRVIPALTAAKRAYPDLAADTDLFRTLLDDDADNMWRSVPCISLDGYVALANWGTKQYAYYNPQTKALLLRPNEPHDIDRGTILEFYTLSDEEGQRPSRVVCVRHDYSWSSVRIAIFSSNTMKWQILPEVATLLPEGEKFAFRTVLDGFVCWNYEREGYMLVLNTATFKLSRMDLPLPLEEANSGGYSGFKIGQTKDGMLCIVGVLEPMLCAWIWTADPDGVERFVLRKTFLLNTAFKDIMKSSAQGQVRIMAVIGGFVYLSVKKLNDPLKSSEWFLSFSLETEELKKIFKSKRQILVGVTPYIMEWPASLVHNKENSESKVAGDSGENGRPAGTEGDPSILTLALQSFREALMDDDESQVAEIDAFLHCLHAEDEKNSLARKIATSNAALIAVRDRVLSVNCRKVTERKSWWRKCTGKLRRAFFSS